MPTSASSPSASAVSALTVGSTVKCFSGSSEQVEQPALSYLWRKCRVRSVEMDGDGRVARLHVSWDGLHDREDEWIQVDSNRVQLPDPARQQSSPTSTLPSAAAAPPPLIAAAATAADKATEQASKEAPPVVSDNVSVKPAVTVPTAAGVSDADMNSFLAHVNDQLPAATRLSAAHSAASSPTSSQAAASMAAQGVDTAFFAAASTNSASSSSSSPSDRLSRRPPPLPANYPPKLPTNRPTASVSPPPTNAPTRSPPPVYSTLLSTSNPSKPVPTDHSTPPSPAPPVAVSQQAAAVTPPHWEPGQLAPLSFDDFSALYRMDPDRYQIYLQQWQAEQQAHIHLPSSQPSSPPPPPPHSTMANNTAHPPPSSLPVSLQPSSHSASSSRPTSRKSSVDSLPPAIPVAEQISEFARDLARGSLVDVWNRKLHMWSNGEVVDVSQSAEKGAMVNLLDYNTNMREWIRRASPRIAPPFTKSQEAAPSPPASPRLPTVQKRPAVVADERSSMQKVGAALSTLSHQGSAALSTMAAALLPASATASPPRSTSANGEASHLAFLSPKSSKASSNQSTHSFVAPTVVAMPTHSAPHPPPAASVPTTSTSSSSATPALSTSSSSSSSSASSSITPSPAQSSTPIPSAAVGNVPEHPAGFAKSLTVGSSIDCLDTDVVWRIAEVTRETAEAVYVHYIGWTAKWDEWILRDSRRIQPARTFTVGDTGPKKPPVVEQPIAQPVQPFQSHTPAVATVSQQRASTRYECRRECKWKRVLSMGLGHREIQSLDLLFDRCCQLQDDYQEILLSAEPGKAALASFHAKMSAVSDEIARLRKSLPAFASFYLQQCSNIVSTVQSGIAEAEEALRRQMLAMQEEQYMRRLRKVFQLVEVPADGDCLFAAMGKGYAKAYEMELQQQQQKTKEQLLSKQPPPVPAITTAPVVSASEDSSAEPESAVAAGTSTAPAETPTAVQDPQSAEAQSAAAEVVQAGKEQREEQSVAVSEQPASQPESLASDSPASPSNKPSPLLSQPPPPALSGRDLARHYRSQAVHQLLASPAMHPLIRHEVHEALIQEREGHSDSTSKAIVGELNDRYESAADLGVSVKEEDGLRVYGDVMSRDGIYGTQLEVQALSKALHVPVHVYYRAGAEDDEPTVAGGDEVKPTQVIGAEEEGAPISLAYYMGNRHYNLLLPRPPPPPPPPATIPPQHVATPPSQSFDISSSIAHDSSQYDFDNELVVALLENGTPSPLPAAQAETAAGNLQIRRSLSGGHLSNSAQTQPTTASTTAAGSGLHKHSGSKDELHLLSASSASKAKSLQTAAKPSPKPPAQAVPSSTATSSQWSAPPSTRNTQQLHVRVVHTATSPIPIDVSLHRSKPLLNLLYGFPTVAKFALRREKDGTHLALDKTPNDYQLIEGETLTLFEAGEESQPQQSNSSAQQPAPPVTVDAQPAPPALPASAPAVPLSAEDRVLVKSVVDGIVNSVVSRAPV